MTPRLQIQVENVDKASVNKLLRRLFVRKRGEAMEDTENYIMRNFIICTLRQISTMKISRLRWAGHVACIVK